VEHFYVKFGARACIGAAKQTDTQTNGGKNLIPTTAVGVGNYAMANMFPIHS